MNKLGDITINEMIGLVLFILVVVLVFSPLGSKAYSIFKGVPADERASLKLDEIISKMDYMAANNVLSDDNIILDSPLNWFLVNEGDKLCICKKLAEINGNQEKICKEYGGVCSEVKYNFAIDDYTFLAPIEVRDVMNEKRTSIKLEGYNFLSIKDESSVVKNKGFEEGGFEFIEGEGNNFFVLRRSSTESELNSVLNEFLNEKIFYGTGEESEDVLFVRDLVSTICDNRDTDFFKNLFEKQVNYFFEKRLDNGEIIRFQIANLQKLDGTLIALPSEGENKDSTNKGLESFFYSFIYPRGEKFYGLISEENPAEFRTVLPSTYEITGYDCVIHLASTTIDLDLKSGDSDE
jgi:hypothetical protein